MKLPVSIACVLLTAVLGVQGWMALQIISLKVQVAAIETALHVKQSEIAKQ